MAHPFYFSCYTKVLVFSLLLFLFLSLCSTSYSKPQLVSTRTSTRVSSRRILEVEEEEQQDEKPLKKKTTTTQSTKNQTKLIKPNTTPSSKNQTKITKSSNLSTKNQTKTIKSNNTISLKNQTKSNATSTKTIKSNNLSPKNQTKQLKVSSKESPKTTPTDTGLKKKLNSTTSASTPKSKKLNSTSKATTPVSTSSKKSLDLVKASNKTTKATATATATDKQTKSKTTTQPHDATKQQSKKPAKQAPPGWFIDEEEDDDMVSISEFRDLPNKFQRTLIPDLERITTTSKAYLTKANDEITKGFKPYVGNKYAPTVAAVASCAFILIPLLLVSLLCTRIKAFFSLQKILIFIQVYLSIYFTILCVSSLVTGIEPLKFLYSVSHSTYLCLQVLQTLAYVFYLLLLLMFLVLVFSTECGLGLKFLGLAQVFVGFAVGLHYYVTVFHRVVLRQPPKTSWKVHGIYATCFLLICVLAGADNRRKKAYVENDGEEGKKN
ncbi:uncharacterized protein LOC130714033 [Lotus japonicus]|uniref:uncharacterized protein LOC130714033 n=1 Tax=Lotus japonicus TaxID=34305 RepID=UPI00258AFEF9|nr:uncharacterized protein LOC130714033 [Lotus japonicus]